MNFFKDIFNKDKDDSESFIPPQTRKIKGIKPIIIYAVEILFSNSKYKNEIFDNLLKGGKKHGTRNILVFIYCCTSPDKEQPDGEQEPMTVEQYAQYLEEQAKNPPLDDFSLGKRFVSEEQAKNKLLKYLSLDRSDVYYFVRDLVGYPGESDMEWITKIKNRKRELLIDGNF